MKNPRVLSNAEFVRRYGVEPNTEVKGKMHHYIAHNGVSWGRVIGPAPSMRAQAKPLYCSECSVHATVIVDATAGVVLKNKIGEVEVPDDLMSLPLAQPYFVATDDGTGFNCKYVATDDWWLGPPRTFVLTRQEWVVPGFLDVSMPHNTPNHVNSGVALLHRRSAGAEHYEVVTENDRHLCGPRSILYRGPDLDPAKDLYNRLVGLLE